MHPSELAAENQALRQQLEDLLREARANEDKMRRFDQLEHRLIAAGSLGELLRLLLLEYRPVFGIEFVGLTLLDTQLEIRSILDAELHEDSALPGLQLPPTLQALDALDLDQRPWLGAYDAILHGALFGAAPGIASVALLPLSRRGQLIGCLQFGSSDAARYNSGAGTKFLERLAAIASVCLESALNQERVKRAGLTDVLTGVHNRRYFEHRCQIEISQARRHSQALACLFLDIDHFKPVNDSHGHAAGDAVLRAVGLMIQGQLRAGDTVARWGGEEFVVLLPRTPAAAAREVAERIRQRIADQRLPVGGGIELAVTVSIGLAMLELAGPPEAAPLLQAADAALYRAKQGGRNQVVGASDPPR
ncbi:sensor domain-containing diguanylate cyclase [Paucibacter sp. O1-1]|nr:DUF484 family protein [Paucibacter sp. O1-1]MDA3825919.1 sensor domain-containing diguanylate cyclase [Paucibacter sp. O1-1]